MSGSVSEFTDECMIDPTTPGDTTICATRGGGVYGEAAQLSCKYYATGSVSQYTDSIGFRCCNDL